MKIVQYDGVWIEYDNEDELSRIYELICATCGHKLSYHGFWVSWSTNKVFPSQCTMRCNCEKFRYMKDEYAQGEHEFYE